MSAVLRTTDGIAYLAPELQLLFKSKNRRLKDDVDAAEVIPALGACQRDLARHLLVDHWAKQLVNRAHEAEISLDVGPDGFVGTLRANQAEALAWIDFLVVNELGGCLALDMGLGKTPTVLAHLARIAGRNPSLVMAPAAVVGNWAAQAARFASDLRVLVHH